MRRLDRCTTNTKPNRPPGKPKRESIYESVEISKTSKLKIMRELRKFKKDKQWSWEKLAKKMDLTKRNLLRWNKDSKQKIEPTMNRTNVGTLLDLLEKNKYSPKIPYKVKRETSFRVFWEEKVKYIDDDDDDSDDEEPFIPNLLENK